MMKRLTCILLAATLTIAAGFTTLAAETRIDKMKITFSYDAEPKSGETIGTINAKTDSNEFFIDSAEYMNETETWTVGDRPQVLVTMTAKDGYKFSSKSKSHFSLSGCNATYKTARTYDDGMTMELEVYLKRIGGKLSDVENLEWSGASASWDSMEGAKSYNVRLYRDEKSITTVETTGTNYDFSGFMNKEGSYTFRVQAISIYNNRAGEWSDYSDDYYLDEEDLWNNTGYGQWVQNNNGWWYSYSSGGYPANTWKNISNVWYYFNRDGYMVTGWLKLDGNWYYLNSSGAMTTGWQLINGRWYCMDSSGVLYVNTRTPDGYYVDGSGALIQ